MLKSLLKIVFLDALVLTLSPAVRERSWQVIYRWDHWIGVLFWGLSFGVAHYWLEILQFEYI